MLFSKGIFLKKSKLTEMFLKKSHYVLKKINIFQKVKILKKKNFKKFIRFFKKFIATWKKSFFLYLC